MVGRSQPELRPMGRTATRANEKNHCRRPSDRRDGSGGRTGSVARRCDITFDPFRIARRQRKDRQQTFVNVFFLNLFAKLRRDVDDVAEAGSLFDDCIGANL